MGPFCVRTRRTLTRMDLWDGPITWHCHVCGSERPDELILVAHRPIPGPLADSFPEARCNVRYCSDNPDCVATATAGGPWTRWFPGRTEDTR